jgi:hypothetical protein
MTIHPLALLLCSATLFWPLVGGAEIYQSRDAAGNVIYSDRPLNAASQKSTLTSPPRGEAPPPAATAPQGPTEVDADSAEIRKSRCEKIRGLIARYEKSEYLTREGPDGKNQILSDVEKARELASLREQEAAQCDS